MNDQAALLVTKNSEGLPDGPCRILNVLCYHAEPGALEVSMSLRDLAVRLRKSVNTVKSDLHWLGEEGWLEEARPAGPRDAAVYKLAFADRQILTVWASAVDPLNAGGPSKFDGLNAPGGQILTPSISSSYEILADEKFVGAELHARVDSMVLDSVVSVRSTRSELQTQTRSSKAKPKLDPRHRHPPDEVAAVERRLAELFADQELPPLAGDPVAGQLLSVGKSCGLLLSQILRIIDKAWQARHNRDGRPKAHIERILSWGYFVRLIDNETEHLPRRKPGRHDGMLSVQELLTGTSNEF